MNPYSIPNLVVSIYTLSLGCFVLWSKPKARKNQLCFVFTLATFVWLFTYGIAYSITTYSTNLILLKIGHISAVLVTPAIYFLFLEVLGPYRRKFDIWASRVVVVLSALAVFLAIFSPLYFKQLVKLDWGFYPQGGPYMLSYALITFVAAIRIIWIMTNATVRARKDLEIEKYQRFKYHAISLILFVFAALDYLPKFGLAFYPFGFVFVGAFSSLTTYAIVKHQLMDVDIFLRRGFVYSLLISAMTFIYLAIIIVFEQLFRSYMGYQSVLIALLSSLVIALIFNPLRSKIQKTIDRHFFKVSTDQLIQQNEFMKSELQKQDRLKAISTIAAGMAHEIKNPITAIRTFAEYLPKKYEDAEFREKFSKIILQESSRIEGIVKDLLLFSKPSEPNKTLFDVQKLLQSTVDLLTVDMLRSKIAPRLECDPAAGQAYADPSQMKQVFLNLLTNAIDAMKENGGELTIRTGVSEKFIRISIEDQGCGIAPEKIPHLFDPFYTDKENGTGLGLSITHSLIEKNGGEIEVQSETGRGTTFRIFLPYLNR